MGERADVLREVYDVLNEKARATPWALNDVAASGWQIGMLAAAETVRQMSHKAGTCAACAPCPDDLESGNPTTPEEGR